MNDPEIARQNLSYQYLLYPFLYSGDYLYDILHMVCDPGKGAVGCKLIRLTSSAWKGFMCELR